MKFLNDFAADTVVMKPPVDENDAIFYEEFRWKRLLLFLFCLKYQVGKGKAIVSTGTGS